jgi:hypothetical protein
MIDQNATVRAWLRDRAQQSPVRPSIVANVMAQLDGVPQRRRSSLWERLFGSTRNRTLSIAVAVLLGGGLLAVATGGPRNTAVVTPTGTATHRGLVATEPPPPSLPSPDLGGPEPDACINLTAAATHAGATPGGWTPDPPRSGRVVDGLVAAVPFTTNAEPTDVDIRLIDPVSGQADKVSDFGLVQPMNELVAWSPGGRYLAYMLTASAGDRGCSGLFLWSPDRLAQVALDPSIDGQWFAWAPDGSAIAIRDSDASGAHITVVRFDHTRTSVPGPDCSGCLLFGLWSPDSTRMAVFGDDQSADSVSHGVVVDLASGVGITLADGIAPMRWIDAESLLAFRSSPLSFVTVSVPTTGNIGTPIQASWPPVGMAGTLSPDLASAVGSFPCADATTETCITIQHRAGPDRVVMRVRSGNSIAFWAPDSQNVVVNVFEGRARDSGIWVVAADGSNLHRISTTPVALSWPLDWQPTFP